MPRRPLSHSERLAAWRRKAADREYNERRGGDSQWYSSARWRRVRRMKLRRDPLCVDCSERGYTEDATEVHHIISRRVAPELAYDLDNLEGLCKGCHSRRTNRERVGV